MNVAPGFKCRLSVRINSPLYIFIAKSKGVAYVRIARYIAPISMIGKRPAIINPESEFLRERYKSKKFI